MVSDNKTTKVVTGKARFAFVHVFEPAETPSGDMKYSARVLIPKSDKQTLKDIRNAQEAAVEAGLKSKFGGKRPKDLRDCLRDGDTAEDQEGNLLKDNWPEYEGHYFINVSSRTQPGVVDRQTRTITDSGEFYSGCYGKASINFFAYNTAGNKGVSAGLNNVQKIADGDYLGGRSRAEDDFEPYDDDDDLDDLI